jgi:hypothetical protein
MQSFVKLLQNMFRTLHQSAEHLAARGYFKVVGLSVAAARRCNRYLFSFQTSYIPSASFAAVKRNIMYLQQEFFFL